jgi:hypothetical protein
MRIFKTFGFNKKKTFRFKAICCSKLYADLCTLEFFETLKFFGRKNIFREKMLGLFLLRDTAES